MKKKLKEYLHLNGALDDNLSHDDNAGIELPPSTVKETKTVQNCIQ
jgi:hypothetical protein